MLENNPKVMVDSADETDDNTHQVVCYSCGYSSATVDEVALAHEWKRIHRNRCPAFLSEGTQ